MAKAAARMEAIAKAAEDAAKSAASADRRAEAAEKDARVAKKQAAAAERALKQAAKDGSGSVGSCRSAQALSRRGIPKSLKTAS